MELVLVFSHKEKSLNALKKTWTKDCECVWPLLDGSGGPNIIWPKISLFFGQPAGLTGNDQLRRPVSECLVWIDTTDEIESGVFCGGVGLMVKKERKSNLCGPLGLRKEPVRQ